MTKEIKILIWILGILIVLALISGGWLAWKGYKFQKVEISTDKTEYEQGEIIKITIENNLKESIFSHIASRTPVFAIEYIERKTPDGNWEKLFAQCQPPHCIDDIDAPQEIKSGQSEILEWEPLIFVNGTAETIQAGPGQYRFVILYQDYKKTEWKSVYSNEFTIKEKKEDEILTMEFTASSRVVESTASITVNVGVAHTCKVDDELLLERIDIYGENAMPVKSFNVSRRLKAVGIEMDRHKSLVDKMRAIEKGEIQVSDEERAQLWAELAFLYPEIQNESFITGRFDVALDKLKSEKVVAGDKLPITAKIYATHEGKPIAISKTLHIEVLP